MPHQAALAWVCFCHGDGFVGHCQLFSLTRGTGGFSNVGHNTRDQLFCLLLQPLASAYHMTSAMSVVTLGRRSIFSSIFWCHPHPSVDSQSGLACCFQPCGRLGAGVGGGGGTEETTF